MRRTCVTLANSHWDVARNTGQKSRIRIDVSFLRHFVGVFAISFSLAVWYVILHFGLHLI
jgi:hypothetical protein